jgi:hypothetical protein
LEYRLDAEVNLGRIHFGWISRVLQKSHHRQETVRIGRPIPGLGMEVPEGGGAIEREEGILVQF